MKKCAMCPKQLSGLQRKFCSKRCQYKHHNFKKQNYECQQARGLKRKRDLVGMLGGECSVCGYRRSLAALCFHHKDPSTKSMSLTIRECSNNSWQKLASEAIKCVLLCANCHMEEHYPHQSLSDSSY